MLDMTHTTVVVRAANVACVTDATRGKHDACDMCDSCTMRDKNDMHGICDTHAGDICVTNMARTTSVMHDKHDMHDRHDTCKMTHMSDTAHMMGVTRMLNMTLVTNMIHMTTTCKEMMREPLANRQDSWCILKSCLCVLGWEYVPMYWCVWMHMEAGSCHDSGTVYLFLDRESFIARKLHSAGVADQ